MEKPRKKRIALCKRDALIASLRFKLSRDSPSAGDKAIVKHLENRTEKYKDRLESSGKIFASSERDEAMGIMVTWLMEQIKKGGKSLTVNDATAMLGEQFPTQKIYRKKAWKVLRQANSHLDFEKKFLTMVSRRFAAFYQMRKIAKKGE